MGKQDTQKAPGFFVGTAGRTMASFSRIGEVKEDGLRFASSILPGVCLRCLLGTHVGSWTLIQELKQRVGAGGVNVGVSHIWVRSLGGERREARGAGWSGGAGSGDEQ